MKTLNECELYPSEMTEPEEMKAFYQAEGYLFLKGFLPIPLLDRLLRDLNVAYGLYSGMEPDFQQVAIHLNNEDQPGLYDLHVATTKLVTLSPINAMFQQLVTAILGAQTPVYQISSGYLLGLPKDGRLVYDFHQESNYMKGFENIFNFHYPIFGRADRANGSMSILPKTHLLGTLGFTKERPAENAYTSLVPENMEDIRQGHVEHHCIIERGDVVVFHQDLIHRSNYNGSDLCRPVGISRLTSSLKGDWVRRRPEEL